METNRFIAPGGWFAINYPAKWCETNSLDPYCFCFCDPNVWSGNFIISVSKRKTEQDCERLLKKDLRKPGAKLVEIGKWQCAAIRETIVEEGETYDNYVWTTYRGCFYALCSFATKQGGSPKAAEKIIATLELRDPDKETYPREIIPLRLNEQVEIEEGCEYVTNLLKKCIKKGFTYSVADLPNLQRLLDERYVKERDGMWPWEALGYAFGCIVENEIEGMKWMTIVDGQAEYPAIRYRDIDTVSDLYFIFEHAGVKSCNTFSFQKLYDQITDFIEKIEQKTDEV